MTFAAVILIHVIAVGAPRRHARLTICPIPTIVTVPVILHTSITVVAVPVIVSTIVTVPASLDARVYLGLYAWIIVLTIPISLNTRYHVGLDTRISVLTVPVSLDTRSSLDTWIVVIPIAFAARSTTVPSTFIVPAI